MIYGADDVYTRMAWDSLEDWRWLSSRAGLPVFHPIGVLMFFGKRERFVDQSLQAHRRLGPAPRRTRRGGAAAALAADLLVGAGSGHGFKHGPAVGRYAADLVTGRLARPEPRFSLASTGESQRREVH